MKHLILYIRIFTKLICIIAVSFLYASTVSAQSDYYDLLLGLGDFNKCTYSRVSGINKHGVVPADNLKIADGWTVSIVDSYPADGDISLNELNGHIFKLVNSKIFTDDGKAFLEDNKSYQYIGMRYNPENAMKSQLYSTVRSLQKYPEETFQPGDKVIFQVDRIISSNFDTPNPPRVAIGIITTAPSFVKVQIDMSKGFVDNVSCTLDILYPTYVLPNIEIRLQKKTPTGKNPGILFTGARLWVQRKNSSQIMPEEAIPYTRNRTLQTQKSYSNVDSVRYLAKNYDVATTNAWEYPVFPVLRKLNPNVKICLYQTTSAVESNEAVRWTISPFKIEDVAIDHPDWLYPQSDPPLKNDPDKNPNLPDSLYVGKYVNTNGLFCNYATRLSNKQFQNEWTRVVIEKAKAIDADGILIDEASCLRFSRDGVQRDTWESQQFIHAVIPKLRVAGLTSVILDPQANLDGSRGWRGDYTEVFHNPFWKPTSALPASAGYSANTPENTPDTFFREYSFLFCNYGYDSEYWLRCINDAKIVASWNAKLPKQTQKYIYYDIQQEDTADHPAFNKDGKAGWATFAFASFLLCNNEYVYYGSGLGQTSGNYYDDTKIDYSITKKLGLPDGEDLPIDNNKYFRMRKYRADGQGGIGGIVVVNGDTSKRYTFSLPADAIDENGKFYNAGDKINFLPNMGRILINASLASETSDVNTR